MKPIYIYETDDERRIATTSPPTSDDKEMVYCGPTEIVRVSICGGALVAHEMTRDKQWQLVSDYEYFVDPDSGRKTHVPREQRPEATK